MIVFIPSLIILIIISVIIIWKWKDDLLGAVLMLVLWILLGGLCILGIDIFVLSLNDGFVRGYSEGQREGYLNKIAKEGVVWKTYEGQIHFCSSKILGDKNYWDFTIPQESHEMYEIVNANIGKKVRINYIEWLIMPYKIGESGYEVVKINIIH